MKTHKESLNHQSTNQNLKASVGHAFFKAKLLNSSKFADNSGDLWCDFYGRNRKGKSLEKQ